MIYHLQEILILQMKELQPSTSKPIPTGDIIESPSQSPTESLPPSYDETMSFHNEFRKEMMNNFNENEIH